MFELGRDMSELQTTFLDELAAPSNSKANQLMERDQAIHSWYRFVLSFPPHLVRRYLEEFKLSSEATLLDPFSGTGTTLVEAKLRGFSSFGTEVNPFAHFAGTVKVSWEQDPTELLTIAKQVASNAVELLGKQGITDDTNSQEGSEKLDLWTLDDAQQKLLITDSISPLPLHKTIVLKSEIDKHASKAYCKYLLLALAKSTVFSASNLRFGPEVGVGKLKKDAPVVSRWLEEIHLIVRDLTMLNEMESKQAFNILADAREISNVVKHKSIDAVITSPPYPNEKDYSRTTRLESVLLGLVSSPEELRSQKKTYIRSNTRGVYKEDTDFEWIKGYPEIIRLAREIEERRIDLGKTSGFEKRYAQVTLEYFGGMARHLNDLTRVLRPGAQLAYVVGDQASYLGVLIRTGKLLAHVAEDLGYSVEKIDLFRTRFATATQEELREEVIILKWDGRKKIDA
jgi:DNA modification methylase